MKTIIDWFHDHQPLLLTTHIIPDGDGLGSQAALYYFLRSKGLDVSILNDHPVPPKFSVVDPKGVFGSVLNGDRIERRPGGVVVLDTHEWTRTGSISGFLTKMGFFSDSDRVLYIDHHARAPEGLSGYMREEACATGELVYDIIEAWQAAEGQPLSAVPQEAMLGVYVSLVTDTGAFQFRRTTPRTHEMASRCIESGVQPYEVYRSIFCSGSLAKMKFEAEVLAQTQVSACGRIASISVPLELQERFGIDLEDTQGLVGRLRVISGIELCVMAREEWDGIKFSMRSLGEIEVVGFAQRHGGGGHRYAAGFKIPGPLPVALQKVLGELTAYLNELTKQVS